MTKVYRLNDDWAEFESALRAELEKLGASPEEVEEILDGAWEATAEVDDVAKYAAEELDLLRNPPPLYV